MEITNYGENAENLYAILNPLICTEEALLMRRFIQHSSITTFDHCVRVATLSYLINRHFKLNADERSLIRGAFLHDFFLYDWHDPTQHKRFHGFHHPMTAALNAEKYYKINDKEKNIITSHMWPLTLRNIPRYKEAAIVCVADKICSAEEVLQPRSSICLDPESIIRSKNFSKGSLMKAAALLLYFTSAFQRPC